MLDSISQEGLVLELLHIVRVEFVCERPGTITGARLATSAVSGFGDFI